MPPDQVPHYKRPRANRSAVRILVKYPQSVPQPAVQIARPAEDSLCQHQRRGMCLIGAIPERPYIGL